MKPFPQFVGDISQRAELLEFVTACLEGRSAEQQRRTVEHALRLDLISQYDAARLGAHLQTKST